MTPTRLLSFVNHVAPAAGTEDAIERAFEWGVDAIVAQGTGTDWGPYWLGSGAQPHTNFTENIRPYVRAAVRYEVPFVFSVGVAGGRPQLEACLTQIDALCREEEMSLTLGVIDTEIDPEYLARAVADGREVPAAYDVPSLSRTLTADDVSEATRIVGLVGPEPIAEMLGRGGLDGVVTGRAVDVALYIALPLQQGLPVAVAAHAAKVIECGGLALEPGDPCLCIWAEIGDESFEVRSPDPRARPTIRGMAAHAFYERANPYREANPGGYLDLSNATYSETDLGVRSSGAQWVDEPYTILVEAAKSEGFRSIVVMGVREPALLEQLDGWITQAEKDIAETDRFADLEMGVDVQLAFRVYGRDGVLGDREPTPVMDGHEACVILEVTGPTQDLADQIAYFAFIRLYAGPYPGRKTTAGNVAIPYMPMVIPLGEAFSFNGYHILPVDHPMEPFASRVESFPRTAQR